MIVIWAGVCFVVLAASLAHVQLRVFGAQPDGSVQSGFGAQLVGPSPPASGGVRDRHGPLSVWNPLSHGPRQIQARQHNLLG